MTLRERYLAVLRIPPPPVPPAGDQHVRVFRAAPNYFRYRVLVWLVRQAGAAIGVVFGVLAVSGGLEGAVPDGAALGPGDLPESISLGPIALSRAFFLWMVMVGELLAVAGFIVQLIVSALLLRLDFEQRWYMVSDRSLRIREGLIKVHEKTMTFANIQHVSIRQGPLQRWLGIADLEVRTAGGGTGKEEQHAKPDMHVGYFRGLDDAAAVRDAIRDRLRRHGDAGLGDPDDVPVPAGRVAIPSGARGAPLPVADLAAAAVLLRDEARALRLSLGG